MYTTLFFFIPYTFCIAKQCADAVKGEMLSVIGLDDTVLQAMCDRATAATGKVVKIANYLFKQGRVLSGEPSAIAHVQKAAEVSLQPPTSTPPYSCHITPSLCGTRPFFHAYPSLI